MSNLIQTIVVATQMLLLSFVSKDTTEWKALDYAIEILEKSKNLIVAYGGRLWIYSEGVYVTFTSKEQTLHFVKQSISKLDGTQHVPSKKIQAVLKELFTQYHEMSPLNDKNVTYINMKSNVLAIHKDGKIETLPHDPKYNFTYKLPYDYNAQATCPVFDKFLATSLVDNQLIKVIGEFIGFILNSNAKKHEKALFAYGDGSNGKSTLINIIKALLGVENISSVELTDMGQETKNALMDGKLLNISSDSKSKGLETASFKKIVSGEPVLGKYLFKDVYTITNLPKIFVATNKLPFTNGDNSGGFYRRLLLIPFTVVIQEEDKDYELEQKVINNELPGILNFAIEGMQRLSEQGRFTEAKAMTKAINNYKEASHHVAKFIEEENYVDVDPKEKKGTSLKKLYNDFKIWCTSYGYNPYSANYLSSELDHLEFISYKNDLKHYRVVKKTPEVNNIFEANIDSNPYTSQ